MSQPVAFPATARLAALRDRIRRLESGGGDDPARRLAAPLGVAAVDACLPPTGLSGGCVHALGAVDAGGGTGFAAWALARIAIAAGRPVVWILRGRDLYAPGLATYGLTPSRLIAVRAIRADDALWAMEEALRCRHVAAVLAEVDKVDLTAGRRLQLAAEVGGGAGFILFDADRNAGARQAPSAAIRWRVASAPVAAPFATDDGDAVACWDVTLERARGGRPGAWRLTCDGTALRPAVELADYADTNDPCSPGGWAPPIQATANGPSAR